MVAPVSGLSLASLSAPTMDLGGGGSGTIAGDVTFGTKDIGEALDQLTREIKRHLSKHKLTVVWLFDESESMKDDQKSIRQKFDRVATELKLSNDGSTKKKETPPLTHAIVGFGEGIDYVLGKPTLNIDVIGTAIDKLKIDMTGTENTMHALAEVIVLVIDQQRSPVVNVLSPGMPGDDGSYVEEVHQLAVNQRVPIYDRAAVALGYDQRTCTSIRDPTSTGRRSAAVGRRPTSSCSSGTVDRWDEQCPALPYELARVAKATGGIYFLLPSEENMRVRQREKAYSIKDLKEYVPTYDSRAAYLAIRNKSEFRRTMHDIIQLTRPKDGDPGFTFRRHFPIDPAQLLPALQEAGLNATDKLNRLLAIQTRLEALERLRDRDPEKRWQAHYDLILAQIVAYQVKAFEYRACLEEMAAKPPRPSKMPNQDLIVE